MRTSAWIEIDKFDKRLDDVILLFDKAGFRSDQARGRDGKWVAEGGGGGSTPKQSKPRRRVTDETVRRRESARLRRLDSVRREASQALDEAKRFRVPGYDTTKVKEIAVRLRSSQEDLKRSLSRAGDALKGIHSASVWWGLAVDSMVTLAAINIAGSIHPLAGVAASIWGIGYMAYQIYRAVKGTY